MRYPSAKSKGFTALIMGVILLLIVSAAIVPADARMIVLSGSALVAAFLLWIWFGTWYEFKEEYLLARLGPFFERIPYEKIFEANKIKSMASSMALSSDMIELRHGKNYITGTTYISPQDRDGFIDELKTRCTSLKL